MLCSTVLTPYQHFPSSKGWGRFLLFCVLQSVKTKETNPTRLGSPTPCKQALNTSNSVTLYAYSLRFERNHSLFRTKICFNNSRSIDYNSYIYNDDSEAFWSLFYIWFGFLCAQVSSGNCETKPGLILEF